MSEDYKKKKKNHGGCCCYRDRAVVVEVVASSCFSFLGSRRSCLSLVRDSVFFLLFEFQSRNPSNLEAVFCSHNKRQVFFFFRHFLLCLEPGYCHIRLSFSSLLSFTALRFVEILINWRVGVQFNLLNIYYTHALLFFSFLVWFFSFFYFILLGFGITFLIFILFF